MLDTNAVSDMMRNPSGRVVARIAAVGPETVCLSVITAAELRYGAAKRGSPALQARVDAILSRLPFLPFGEPADAAYARVRTELEAAGQPIGPNDLLIAAHALSLPAMLVTNNVREFLRVTGLYMEDWSAAS